MGGFAEALMNFNTPESRARTALVQGEAARNKAVLPTVGPMAQAQLQSEQLKTQLQQAQVKDAESIRQLYADDKVNGDPNAMQKAAAGKLSGPGFSAFMANQLEIQKMKLANTEATNKIAGENRNRAGDIIDGINKQAATDPVIAGATYEAQLPLLQKLAPETPWAPKYDPKYGEFLSDHVGHTAKVLGEKKTIADISAAGSKAAQEAADAALKTAQTLGATAKSSMETRQAAAMENMTPATLKQQVDAAIDPAKYRGENARTFAMAQSALANGLGPQEVQKRITDGADRIGRQESAIAQARATAPIKIQVGAGLERAKNAIGMETPGGAANSNLRGQEYLDTLPSGLSSKVKAIVEGRQTPFTGRAGATGLGGQVMNAVYQADPEFSEQRAQIRKAFTTGPTANNIAALNTATVHLDQYGEALKALKNGSFVPGNESYNYFAGMFGSAPPTNATALSNAVAGELASALKGVATDAEIAAMHKGLSNAASPEQGQGAVKTNLHILGAKLNTYQERYHQQIPNDSAWSPLLPSAKAVFEKYGINPTAGPAKVSHNTGGERPPLSSFEK